MSVTAVTKSPIQVSYLLSLCVKPLPEIFPLLLRLAPPCPPIFPSDLIEKSHLRPLGKRPVTAAAVAVLFFSKVRDDTVRSISPSPSPANPLPELHLLLIKRSMNYSHPGQVCVLYLSLS